MFLKICNWVLCALWNVSNASVLFLPVYRTSTYSSTTSCWKPSRTQTCKLIIPVSKRLWINFVDEAATTSTLSLFEVGGWKWVEVCGAYLHRIHRVVPINLSQDESGGLVLSNWIVIPHFVITLILNKYYDVHMLTLSLLNIFQFCSVSKQTYAWDKWDQSFLLCVFQLKVAQYCLLSFWFRSCKKNPQRLPFQSRRLTTRSPGS